MDLNHVAEMLGVALGGSVPVMLYMMSNKKQAKADADRRSEEQQKLVSGLVTERKYFPAHAHSEKAGPLSAENINYPPEDK